MKKIIVIHFPCQPHFFSYGGFDIQMDRVIELTNNSKVISKKVDLWSKSEQFDIAHFWGVSESHKRNVMFCKNNGIKTVVSGLFSQKSYKLKCKQKIFNFLNKISFNKSVLYDFDIITVINKQQAQVVNEFFGIKTSKIKIVPTILDDYLYNVDKINSKNNKKFVLCVGTICSRKNQIKLAEACIKLDYECIFVGDSINDALCAKNSKSKLVLLEHGYSNEDINNMEADFVCADLKNFCKVISSL